VFISFAFLTFFPLPFFALAAVSAVSAAFSCDSCDAASQVGCLTRPDRRGSVLLSVKLSLSEDSLTLGVLESWLNADSYVLSTSCVLY
jgi:hypothetical protein